MPSQNTRLRIENRTHTDIITTSVSGTDNYDWDSGCGPHRNFRGVQIKAGGSVEKREEINSNARSCPFTMTVTFRDGTQDTFRINQKVAVGSSNIAFSHPKEQHKLTYKRSGDKTLVMIFENTTQQIQEELAEKLKKDAELLMSQRRYEEALRKLNEAASSANQSNTINSIRTNQAECYNQLGQASLQKGFELEANTTQDQSKEAKIKFENAKSMFQQAEGKVHTTTQQNNLKLTELKIEANQLFNEANESEKEAYKLFQEATESKSLDNYVKAENKYKEALNKYQQAKDKFDEGSKMKDSRFEECSKIVNTAIEKVSKVITDVRQIELNYNMNQLNVDEEKKEHKTDVDENKHEHMQEQVDV